MSDIHFADNRLVYPPGQHWCWGDKEDIPEALTRLKVPERYLQQYRKNRYNIRIGNEDSNPVNCTTYVMF